MDFFNWNELPKRQLQWNLQNRRAKQSSGGVYFTVSLR